ncbi:hypothetical protein A6A12_0116 [Vibrio anguillarum]|nr:hypothetical protein A6A12_0116 [Vibrio anguillarum]
MNKRDKKAAHQNAAFYLLTLRDTNHVSSERVTTLFGATNSERI